MTVRRVDALEAGTCFMIWVFSDGRDFVDEVRGFITRIGVRWSEVDAARTSEGGLCCTNPVRDSCCESSVIAGGHEQTEHTDLQDAELARV